MNTKRTANGLIWTGTGLSIVSLLIGSTELVITFVALTFLVVVVDDLAN